MRVDSKGWRILFFIALLSLLFSPVSEIFASDVIIIADTRLKPVAEIIDSIRDALPYDTEVMTPDKAKKHLNGLVSASGAKVVVALGAEAINISLSLPENISLVYGLVVTPLKISRQNVTGIYLATPINEYLSLLARYTPQVRKIGIVCEQEMVELVSPALSSSGSTVLAASSPYEFISRIASIRQSVDAFLLLPEKNLLSVTVTEELYRISFSEKIPVIGASERHVKMGSLLALVFDDVRMGRQIGEVVKKVVARGGASGIPVVSAERFNLFLNLETAKIMKISLPDDLLGIAKRIYP